MENPADPMITASTTVPVITVKKSKMNHNPAFRPPTHLPGDSTTKFPGNFKTSSAAQIFNIRTDKFRQTRQTAVQENTAGHTKCPKISAKPCPGSTATSTPHIWPMGGWRYPTDSKFRLQASETGFGRMTVQPGPSPTCQTVPSVNLTLPSPHPSANPRISVKMTLTASEMTARGYLSHQQRVFPAHSDKSREILNNSALSSH